MDHYSRAPNDWFAAANRRVDFDSIHIVILSLIFAARPARVLPVYKKDLLPDCRDPLATDDQSAITRSGRRSHCGVTQVTQ
jgi:hypothetical protein